MANVGFDISIMSVACNSPKNRPPEAHDNRIGQIGRKSLLLARGQANKIRDIPDMGEFVTVDTPDLWRAISPCKYFETLGPAWYFYPIS